MRKRKRKYKIITSSDSSEVIEESFSSGSGSGSGNENPTHLKVEDPTDPAGKEINIKMEATGSDDDQKPTRKEARSLLNLLHKFRLNPHLIHLIKKEGKKLGT